MDTFTIRPKGPFSLAESAAFGFGQRDADGLDTTMRLAFVVDGGDEACAVAVRQRDDGTVVGEVAAAPGRPAADTSAVRAPVGGRVAGRPAADTSAVRAQVARMLSLDHDAHGFVAVGETDPVVARLLAVAPGLRPPLFHSPYEAALWAVLSARRGARGGARSRQMLSEAAGTRFVVAGREAWAVPGPGTLTEAAPVAGIEPVRMERLRGVAAAALDGRLDAQALLAVAPSEALATLRTVPGIGPFYASLILLRACGTTDLLPEAEPRLQACVGQLYGLGRPAEPAELAAIGAGWAPWRTWVAVLCRAAFDRLPTITPMAGSPTHPRRA